MCRSHFGHFGSAIAKKSERGLERFQWAPGAQSEEVELKMFETVSTVYLESGRAALGGARLPLAFGAHDQLRPAHERGATTKKTRVLVTFWAT